MPVRTLSYFLAISFTSVHINLSIDASDLVTPSRYTIIFSKRFQFASTNKQGENSEPTSGKALSVTFNLSVTKDAELAT